MQKIVKMSKVSKIRVGMIDFTNGLIPDYQLELIDCEKVYGMPAELNRSLRNGVIDVSPVSCMEYFLNFSEYEILPQLCIRADSRAATVGVFSRLSPKDWNGCKIYLSGASLTSVYLLQLLCKAHYEVHPTFIYQKPEAVKRESLEQVLEHYDGMLIIGDQAYQAQSDLGDKVQYYDLATAWKEWTGLPFVFALWLVRKQIIHERNSEIFQIHQAFVRSVNAGLSNLDKVCLKASGQWTRDRLMEYFEFNLGYELNDSALAGLVRFRDELFRWGFLSQVPPLNFFNESTEN